MSAITASRDVLVSGVYRVDPSRAFIIRIRNNAEPEEPGREEFEVPGAGAIRFVESIDDRITRFRFDGNREGFFDLAETGSMRMGGNRTGRRPGTRQVPAAGVTLFQKTGFRRKTAINRWLTISGIRPANPPRPRHLCGRRGLMHTLP